MRDHMRSFPIRFMSLDQCSPPIRIAVLHENLGVKLLQQFHMVKTFLDNFLPHTLLLDHLLLFVCLREFSQGPQVWASVFIPSPASYY